MKVVTVGRCSENDVVINDPMVSRHHLQIIQDEYWHYRLAAFASSNSIAGICIGDSTALHSFGHVRLISIDFNCLHAIALPNMWLSFKSSRSMPIWITT